MIARTAFVAVLAASALATPAAAAAATPDLSAMAVAQSDLPAGTSVLSENLFNVSKGVPEYDRTFALPRSSGFTRLNSGVILFKRSRGAEMLFLGTRLALSDPQARRGLAKFVASELGVRARRVRVGTPRPARVGDDGFTVNVRVNRRAAIVVGVFRVDRAIGEIDARGAHGPAGLRGRTLGVMRIAADRVRHGLSPQPLTPPAITGSATVGGVLHAGPGTWSAATSFSYAWQRCNAAGTCTAVAGATLPDYTVTAADAGLSLRVVVTAANVVGQTAAASAPTAPVPAS